MKKLQKVMMFANGSFAVFADGEQVGELQGSAVDLWAKYAASLGYDPEGVELLMPHDIGIKHEIIKLSDGEYSYRAKGKQ